MQLPTVGTTMGPMSAGTTRYSDKPSIKSKASEETSTQISYSTSKAIRVKNHETYFFFKTDRPADRQALLLK